MLGLPAEHFELFRRWSDGTMAADALAASPEFAAVQAQLEALMREQAALRRREPRDDLISAVVAAEREGVLDFGGAESFAGFAKDDLVSFAQFILIAGNETTRNAISRGMLALIVHPEQRALLRARPELLPTRGRRDPALVEPRARAAPRAAARHRAAREEAPRGRLGAAALRAPRTATRRCSPIRSRSASTAARTSTSRSGSARTTASARTSRGWRSRR